MLKFLTNKPFAIYNAHPAGEKTVSATVRRQESMGKTECAGEGENRNA